MTFRGRMRGGSVVLMVLSVAWTVLAQSSSPMREGMWEVAFKLVMPGMEMPPTKSQQCITAAMIKDPESAIPKMDNGCKISDFKLAGTTATYTMTCTQPMAITAAGEIKYAGPDAYTGTLKVIGPEPALTLSYDAKRIGECTK